MCRPHHRSAAALLATALAVLLAVAGCTDDRGRSASPSTTVITVPDLLPAEAPPVVTVPDGFVLADTRGVRLLPLPGAGRADQPGVAVTGGAATVSGIVQGPDGPVAGATVLVERFVGDRSGSIRVTAGADGRFRATGLLGGRFRIRGWLPPSLTTTQAVTTFLAIDGQAEVTLELRRFDGRQLLASLDVGGLEVGGRARVRALLTRESVDGDGIVVGAPVAGEPVRLTAGAGFVVIGENPASTGADGSATFVVECVSVGTHQLSVATGDLTATVAVPVCGPRPTTTTTTAPTPQPVPVGSPVTVPFPGVLPAGTYRSGTAGCTTAYQLWDAGTWRDRLAGPTLEAPGPIRDLRTPPGATPCAYERVR